MTPVNTLQAIFLLALFCSAFFGQTIAPPSILEIDVQNNAFYISDVTDFAKLASNPNMTTSPFVGRAFVPTTAIGDIVAINGKPAKGVWVVRILPLPLRPMPQPGQPVADVLWNNLGDSYI